MTRAEKIKKTTIYDLAKLTDVSASAVSAILNGSWEKRRISKTLADRVKKIAEEQGYALNRQASLLRSKKSNVIGMLLPKYDNRYFGSIAERFEEMARERNMLPIITCTRRDPELELEAARAMLSWQVDWIVATGTTFPDKITELCQQAGVPVINLDLPGTLAPSIISDNYTGAKKLTENILDQSTARYGTASPLYFIGGRKTDHNTAERLRGFIDAHAAQGLSVPEENLLVRGYSLGNIALALEEAFDSGEIHLPGIFVNSTISLEGVVDWLAKHRLTDKKQPPLGCFDWDPLVSLLGHNISMVRQDVPAMLDAVFKIIDTEEASLGTVEISPVLVEK
ncbi:LacI family DNA-binding transcriptional regulator [Serratia proteamaculans]|uniref:LacI family DNA-binding transcriptional regulator n=1 Tax=Serratia proteamaculans TaxID=28151 RepID=A0A5Q2VKG1_SERPR|nr:LacI family DNA-binding transcriptional regulator [Serratia proteamaculans]QGH64345.1 LacI family DNA-binding transcriptional regulator [Serratia proteamaculans]